jgi:uncharacterized protein DUF3570
VQLEPSEKRPAPLREVLHTAALALLLVPAAAKADQTPSNQVDVTNLFYGEQGRTQVIEPVVRFAHLFADGQSISAQFTIDAITGASLTGALPSGQVQTRTTASGRVVRSAAGALPTAPFNDHRFALGGEWKAPVGRFVTTTLGGHVSREKDYQSFGLDAGASVDLMQRMVTISFGGGISHDDVFPVGGTPAGLSDGTIIFTGKNSKKVTNLLLGGSRILSRRWMMSINGVKTIESGYLTEPYKLVSVVNRSGVPVSELTDKRPTTRDRNSVLLSSVYHFTDDVLYTSYRYYWDSWSVRSHTIDAKYRHDVTTEFYVEPLIRLYSQSAASFYTGALIQGQPLPDFATSDYRLGSLRTFSIGSTFGYTPEDGPGAWTVRAEWIRQAGDSSPPNAIGIQRRFDLSPPLNIYAIVVGYSFSY